MMNTQNKRYDTEASKRNRMWKQIEENMRLKTQS